jgi:hypothetical protein
LVEFVYATDNKDDGIVMGNQERDEAHNVLDANESKMPEARRV